MDEAVNAVGWASTAQARHHLDYNSGMDRGRRGDVAAGCQQGEGPAWRSDGSTAGNGGVAQLPGSVDPRAVDEDDVAVIQANMIDVT